ncbi:MAG: TatD family hydrolase [Desulfamplus sp.]|nr:TatD family hydrolase [Desulfamplus sp.]
MVAGVTPETIAKAIKIAQRYNNDYQQGDKHSGCDYYCSETPEQDQVHKRLHCNFSQTETPEENHTQQQHVFISVGMHPHDAQYCSDDIIDDYKLLARQNPSVVKAWGETGLDFNRMHSPRDLQEKWFVRQLEAADELSLPVIFHERDSDGKFLQILESMNHRERKGVVHCFSGTKQEMFGYLDLGYYIGITGILTVQQRGMLLRELALLIPEERIVIETDAPYLTPVPMKNKTRRNEPAFVEHVLHKLAQIRGVKVETLAEVLWNNTCSLYNISL